MRESNSDNAKLRRHCQPHTVCKKAFECGFVLPLVFTAMGRLLELTDSSHSGALLRRRAVEVPTVLQWYALLWTSYLWCLLGRQTEGKKKERKKKERKKEKQKESKEQSQFISVFGSVQARVLFQPL